MSQQTQIGQHKTSVFTEDGYTRVVYHSTAVVKFNQMYITLNNGGWQTITTKVRMNQASNQFGLGYQVFQKDYSWYVSYNEKVYSYYNGMVINRIVKQLTLAGEVIHPNDNVRAI